MLRGLRVAEHDVRTFVVKCGNSQKSAHPPLWQACKVLRPWALFRETTVIMAMSSETASVNLRVTRLSTRATSVLKSYPLLYAVLYYNVGTGTGQTID